MIDGKSSVEIFEETIKETISGKEVLYKSGNEPTETPMQKAFREAQEKAAQAKK